jgi:hemerythrin
MSLVKWNPNYSVQNTAMDNQHQRLFELINKLHDAMGQGKGMSTLPEIFDNMLQYTKVHFTAEEALLKKHNYPNFETHKKLHDELIAKLVQLQKQFQSGDLSVSMQTRDFLRVWLVEHIQGNDLKYGKYLNDRGLS